MYNNYREHLDKILKEITEAGLYKNERIIVSPQGAEIELETGQKVLNQIIHSLLRLQNQQWTIMATGCRQ
jgi:glycine C-acetyltransferase